MKDLIISELGRDYTVKERDTGRYGVLKKSGMTFRISSYDVEGLGSMSVIDMKAMLGLMQMESVILTAEEKDLPLFSMDFIKAAGKCTLLEEFYDNMIDPLDDVSAVKYRQVKMRYSYLPKYETESRWYDGIRYDFTLGATDKRLKALKEEITAEYLAAYLDNAKRATPADPAVKKAKTAQYVDGLFRNGGPAVDQFKKLFGEETAREVFERFVFSCR
ncbi:MAG: hypothetical protein J5569_07420 [Oscillospiraceae bacterium]|nr:hypothetical protein [Oscillospiraceae bacterium]